MLTNTLIRRMALAAALSAGVGGAATTAVPGLSHWPTTSVIAVVAAITILGGLLRKVVHVVVVVGLLTAALVLGDAATGGHIQETLNLGPMLRSVVGQ